MILFFRYFLSAGYAVIFLHREESLKPVRFLFKLKLEYTKIPLKFSRKYLHLFDHLDVVKNKEAHMEPLVVGRIVVT